MEEGAAPPAARGSAVLGMLEPTDAGTGRERGFVVVVTLLDESLVASSGLIVVEAEVVDTAAVRSPTWVTGTEADAVFESIGESVNRSSATGASPLPSLSVFVAALSLFVATVACFDGAVTGLAEAAAAPPANTELSCNARVDWVAAGIGEEGADIAGSGLDSGIAIAIFVGEPVTVALIGFCSMPEEVRVSPLYGFLFEALFDLQETRCCSIFNAVTLCPQPYAHSTVRKLHDLM